MRYNKLAFSPFFSCFLTFWFLKKSEYHTLTKPESVTYQWFQAFIIVFWHQYRPTIWQIESYLLTFSHIRFVQKVENKKFYYMACNADLSFSPFFSSFLAFLFLSHLLKSKIKAWTPLISRYSELKKNTNSQTARLSLYQSFWGIATLLSLQEYM